MWKITLWNWINFIILDKVVSNHLPTLEDMLMEKAKEVIGGVVMAGDGHHDSMGHSAKFYAYSMFCCTLAKIIHFDLVQVL